MPTPSSTPSAPPSSEQSASSKFLQGRFAHNLVKDCLVHLDEQIAALTLENVKLKSDLNQARTSAALARAAAKTTTGETKPGASKTSPSSSQNAPAFGLQKAIQAHRGQAVAHSPVAEPTGINRAIAAHKASKS